MKQSDVNTSMMPHGIKLTNGQMGIEVLLLVTTVSVIYVFLALFSFHATDPGWSQTALNEAVRNWGGAMGAYFADFLLQMFGNVAYGLPFVLLILCMQLVHYFYYSYGKPINYFTASLRMIGLLTFLFSFTGFFSLNISDRPYYKAGGIIGELISGEIYLTCGQIGSSLLFLALAMISMTLLTGYSWLFFAEKLGNGIVFVTWPLLNVINRYWVKRRHSSISKPFHTASLLQKIFPALRQRKPEFTPSTGVDKATETGVILNAKPAPELTSLLPESEPVMGSKGERNFELGLTHITEESAQKTPLTGSCINPYYQDNSEADYAPIKDLRNDEIIEIHPRAMATAINAENSESHCHNQDKISVKLAPIPTQPVDQHSIHDSLIHPFLRPNTLVMSTSDTPLPGYELLHQPPVQQAEIDFSALESMARRIEKSLADFRVKARVIDYRPGPVVTLFEIELAAGIKASRISTLDRDLARSLSMPSVRVVEVIPGKPYVGLELPNKHRETVYFREVLDTSQFHDARSPLTVVLGKDIGGVPVVADIAKMPHLLVAGTTGSGKSVGVNAMILSILYKATPEDVRFIMIDPKMLELSIYEGIPHLLTEVVTDMKDAANALNWCVNEMERRYRLMSVLGVRNINGYNEKIQLAQELGRPIPDPLWKPNENQSIDMPVLEKLPYVVVMVDEFADLIMAVGKKVEELIARLAQKARAAGIHLVLATQRPSVDVITGLIKANIPTRIAFTVSSKIDSRTILDQSGAESLLGMGDMLYLAPNGSIPLRVHGAFVRDEEVHAVVQDWKARGKPKYIENVTNGMESETDGLASFDDELDPLFDHVVAFVIEKRRASISSVQRQFRIGYNRAARIVEQMEMQGIVSPPGHNGNREVIAPPNHSEY